MKPSRILVEAAEIVSRDHTTEQLAVNQAGEKCRPADPEAVAWTITGAVGKVACPDPQANGWMPMTFAGESAISYLERIAERDGHSTVVPYDNAQASDRARLFRRAISLAEEAEELETRPPVRPVRTGNSPRGHEHAR